MLDITPQTALTLIPLLPLAGFVVNGLWGKKLSPVGSGALATISIGLAFVMTVICAGHVFGTGNVDAAVVTSHGYSWIASDDLSVNLMMRMDQLGMIMTLIITGVGSLIHLYSVGYMSHDKSYWRYFAYLNLFCFAMLCLVLGDNMVMMFLGWEGVGLCSYLLIGFWFDDVEKSKAGKKAFIANRVGDLGFLIGMFLLMWHVGSLTYTDMSSNVASMKTAGTLDPAILTLAGFFLFIGACGKSAQIPLYVWLPDAMAGPTPVSALIHAATMVTAGVYMISRLNFVYCETTWVMPLIAVVGGLTALFAATIGLVQRDIKKVLAYSTVSQLGFMFVAVGCGAYSIAVFHLMTHAFFKAQLFLGSGSVIHALEHGYGHGNPQSQDMTLMGGMKAKMPWTCWTMFVGGLALAGIPLLSGFFSKDEILLMAFDYHGDYKIFFTVAYAMCVLAAACTAFYTARLLGMTFFGTFRGDKKVWDHLHESPGTMVIPLVVLAVLAAIGGYINLPHNVAHGADHFVQFLNGSTFRPAIAAAEAHEHGTGTMWINMILSSVVAVGMFWFGFTFYKSEGGLEKARARAEGGMKGFYTLLYNKYWVDEIYEKVIIRPIRVSSQALLIGIDMLLIDLVVVSGPAYVVALLSHVFRRIQSGLVSHYVMLMTGGVIVILLWVLL